MEIKPYNLKIFQFCILLIPPFLITGPFMPDFLLSIGAILFLYLILKKNILKEFFEKKIILFFFIFCIYILIRSLFAEEVILSLSSSLFYFRFGLFALMFYSLMHSNKNLLNPIFYIFVLIYLILFIDSSYQLVYKVNLFGFFYDYGSNFRVTSLFGKDEVLGSYVVRFFPFVLYLYFSFNHKNYDKYKIIIFIITIISLYISIISGERTSLGLMIISIFLLIFGSKYLRKTYLYLVLSGLILFAALFNFDQRIKNRILDQTITQVFNTKENRLIIFSKTYEGHYQIALNMFKEKPLLGHGTKMFRHYCKKPENFVADHACTTHPHNILMQLLGETGIIGSAFYFFTYFIILFHLFKNSLSLIVKKTQLINDKLLCLMIFYFINWFPLLPSGNFFNNWMSIIYFFPAGCFLYEYYLTKELNKND